MSRLRAFSIHLAASAAVAALVISTMLLLWYRPPFFSALGGQKVLLILLGVDMSFGPLFTLIIFNPKKSRRALAFDLSVIAILQVAALVYGMSVIFHARPVFVVFSKNSFDLVTANMLTSEDLARAKLPDYRSLPIGGPVYVYAEMPTGIAERNEITLSAFAGKDLPQYPEYYMPYQEHMELAGLAARPVDELRNLNAEKVSELDDAIRASGRPESEVGFLPLRARYQDQAVLVGRKDGKVLGVLPLKPWTAVRIAPLK
jgi:hypothetical protein